MTRREVIEQLESLLAHCKTMLESGDIWQRDCEVLHIAIAALRAPTREQVDLMRGIWENRFKRDKASFACSKCGKIYGPYIAGCANFCPACGAPMTDEAVEIIMKRLEALYDTKNQ